MIKKDLKQKYFLFCREKRIETEKIIPVKFAQDKDITYIRRIEIKEL